MKYDPHGHYHLWCNGSTLYAELTGAWNMEAALAFERDMMAHAQTLPAQWGHLVYLDHWELGTPEITAVIERLVTWCIHNGLQRAANVYEPSGIKSALLKKMVVEEQGEFKRAVFNNSDAAAQWLTQEGFPSTSAR